MVEEEEEEDEEEERNRGGGNLTKFVWYLSQSLFLREWRVIDISLEREGLT